MTGAGNMVEQMVHIVRFLAGRGVPEEQIRETAARWLVSPETREEILGKAVLKPQ